MAYPKKKNEPIGEFLKVSRLKLKLTADEVGALCNVSRSRVYQWEAGDYVFPKNLVPLSFALNVTVKKLQALNGSPPSV